MYRRALSAMLVSVTVVAGLVLVPGAPVAAKGRPAADAASRPDRLSAMSTARAEGHRVEDLSQRTPASSTFANPNGSWTTVAAAAATRAPSGSGWAPIDPSITRSRRGFAPKNAPYEVTFGGRGSATIASVTPSSTASFGIGWGKPLVTPKAVGNTLTYPAAAGEGDLVVTSTNSGFDYSIVLRRRPTGPASFAVPIAAKGAELKYSANGSILVVRGKQILARMSAPLMWDSVNNSSRVPVATSIAKTRGGLVLTMRPSAAWLADSKRVYPVTVDPTVTINGSGDTWVDSGSNTSSQSTSTELHVGTQNAGTTIARSYLNFDISSLTANPGVVVSAATLNLTDFDAGTCPATGVKVSQVTSAWSPSTLTWATQPSTTSTGSSTSTQAFGGTGGCAAAPGTVSLSATSIVQSWINGTANDGVQLAAVTETANSGWRRFYSSRNGTQAYFPTLSVTYMTTPTVPASGSITPGTSSGSTVYTNNNKPTFVTAISDPDGGTVTGEVKITQGSTTIADWTSSSIASGGQVTYTPTTALTDGSYSVQWRASNGTLTSGWSTTQAFFVDTVAPTTPAVSCTSFANNTWYTTAPASSTTCSITISSDTKWLWVWNGLTWLTFPPGSGGTSSMTFAIQSNDSFYLYATASDVAGNQSSTTYSFGTGDGGFAAPTVGQGFAASLPIDASAPSGATSAIINWRPAGTSTWTQATQLTSGGSNWTGSVTTAGNISRTGSLLWNAGAETGVTAPESLEIQACFTYSSGQKCGSPRLVSLLQHAFGGAFPTTSIGPASVSLMTGEFQIDQTDVSVPGYQGALTLSRTFQSLGAAVTPANSIFGPGWTANLDGTSVGAADQQVLDQTATTGTIQLIGSDGSADVYKLGGPALDAAGTYLGQGDTATLNTKLQLIAGSPKTLQLTDNSGAVTTWTEAASGTTWNVTSVSDPTNSTLYTYSSGYLSGMYDAPPGITCTATTQNRGCHALTFTYTGTGTGTRLTEVDFTTWDPRPGSNGLPTSAAAMTTTPVRRYSYDGNGRLQYSWDPRLDHSGYHIMTTYAYQTIGGRTLLASLTPNGQPSWNFNVDSGTGALQTITRAQDSAIGGTATWRLAYNVATSGSGLPDLSSNAIKTWGQSTAPDHATAVFGPNAPLNTTDYTYAQLYYFTNAGVSTNTAEYGAGQWDISSQEFDANGNQIWSLTPGNRAAGISNGWTGAQIRALLGTTTVYSADGSRVENTTYPTSWVINQSGTSLWGSKRVVNTYDDEAATADMPGKPTSWTNADTPRHNVLIKSVDELIDWSGVVYDPHTTWYRYDPVATGDGNGWTLGLPTRTSTSFGSGWSTTITRYDSQGHLIEKRSPQGVSTNDGAGSDARSTITTYYTADTSSPKPACQSRPEWAGQECAQGPAGSSSAPALAIGGFDYLGDITQIAQTAASSQHVVVTVYDIDGRKTSVTLSSVNAPTGEVAVAPTYYAYDVWTGLLDAVGNGTTNSWTTYDSWDRVLTQDDGNGNTATTTYNAGGQVATTNDGKGTYTYTYDGTDANGQTERRGLVTRVDVGLASGSGVMTAAYDPDGNQTKEVDPNGVYRSQTYDTSDQVNTLAYYQSNGSQIAAWVAYRDVEGRIRSEQGPISTDAYGYDDRGRLTTVQDNVVGSGCTTRVYGLTLDSDRTSLTSYAPSSTGACSTTTTATTTSGSFNSDDEKTDTGYVYDTFGRTTTLPAVDTATPSNGSVSAAYYANDMVASLSEPSAVGGSLTEAYSLDIRSRISSTTASTAGVALRISTNHYADNSDSAAWVDNQTRPDGSSSYSDTWIRNVVGPDGALALSQHSDGTSQIEIVNLHGDVVSSLPNTTYGGLTNYNEASEYGIARTNTAPLAQYYTWLGTQRRSDDTPGGLFLMGVRLYNPQTGRFLTRDPVQGGNDNAYVYPPEPIGMADTSGATPYFYRCLNAGCLGLMLTRSSSGGWQLRITISDSTFPIFLALFYVRISFGTYGYAKEIYTFRPGVRNLTVYYNIPVGSRRYFLVSVTAFAHGIYWWDWSMGFGWVSDDLGPSWL